jgi:hypothetical protein
VHVGVDDYVTISQISSTSASLSVFGRWALKGDESLGLQDLASHPAHLACDDTVATYKAKFSQNCDTLLISAKYEPCEVRGKLMGIRGPLEPGNVTLTRVKCDDVASLAAFAHGSVCAAPLRLPAIYHGSYAGDEAETDDVDAGAFTVALAHNGAYIEVNRRAVFFGIAAPINNSGAVALREIASLDKSHVCTKGVGLYSLQPTNLDDAACAHSFKFEAQAADKCLERYERLDGVTLHRFDVCLAEHARYVAREMHETIWANQRAAIDHAAAKQALDISREPKPFLPAKHIEPYTADLHEEHVQRRHRHHYVHVDSSSSDSSSDDSSSSPTWTWDSSSDDSSKVSLVSKESESYSSSSQSSSSHSSSHSSSSSSSSSSHSSSSSS